jgi:hypothetical protein
MSVQDLGVTINTKLLEHTKFYKSSKYMSKSNNSFTLEVEVMWVCWWGVGLCVLCIMPWWLDLSPLLDFVGVTQWFQVVLHIFLSELCWIKFNKNHMHLIDAKVDVSTSFQIFFWRRLTRRKIEKEHLKTWGGIWYMEGGCYMEEGHKVPQIRWSQGGGSETCGMYQMHQHLSLPPEMAWICRTTCSSQCDQKTNRIKKTRQYICTSTELVLIKVRTPSSYFSWWG